MNSRFLHHPTKLLAMLCFAYRMSRSSRWHLWSWCRRTWPCKCSSQPWPQTRGWRTEPVGARPAPAPSTLKAWAFRICVWKRAKWRVRDKVSRMRRHTLQAVMVWGFMRLLRCLWQFVDCRFFNYYLVKMDSKRGLKV